MPSSNPRYANSAKRNEIRRWVLATQDVCALCGKPVDKTLTTYIDPKDGKKKRHPMSAEVDEIVPLSLGGSPISRDNVQLAHRICNQRKGNKTSADRARVLDQPLPTSRRW